MWKRFWARLSAFDDGSSTRYIVPSSCQECSLHVETFKDDEDGSKWDMYMVFPVHPGRVRERVKEAWRYLLRGEWPSGLPMQRQDLVNLRAVLDEILTTVPDAATRGTP